MKAALRAVGYFLLKQANAPYGSIGAGYRGVSEPLCASVDWTGAEDPQLSGELFEQFSRTDGAHKWHHYFAIYEELFQSLRGRPIRILEIGVYQGASLKVWKDYFHPDSLIVGIDIDKSCARFDAAERGAHVRIGPQQDPVFLAEVVREFGPFDLIIDDGSHMTSHMIETFNHLFESGLEDGGLYVAEDTHCNYWPTHQDGDISFVDFCFHLVDAMHAHYERRVGEPRFRFGEASARQSLRVPLITTLLAEVRFWDSIVAIRKKKRSLPLSQHW